MNQPVRMAVAAAIVWYALGMPGYQPAGGGAAPYVGGATAAHTASRAMPSGDRATLSAALSAAGDALAADSLGMVADTLTAQKFVKSVLEFSYVGMGKPAAKYPAVASAIQQELEAVFGSEVSAIDAGKRSAIASKLQTLGAAVR